jgi:hypothetical protein
MFLLSCLCAVSIHFRAPDLFRTQTIGLGTHNHPGLPHSETTYGSYQLNVCALTKSLRM